MSISLELKDVKISGGKFSVTASAGTTVDGVKLEQGYEASVIKGKHGIYQVIGDTTTYEYTALTGGEFAFANDDASIASFDAGTATAGVKVTVDGAQNTELKKVITGAGKDVVSVKALADESTFDLGAGNDSIDITASIDAAITLGDGKDTVSVTNDSSNNAVITITDYNYNDDTLFFDTAANAAVNVDYDASAFKIDGTNTTITASTKASDGVYELKLSDGNAATHFVRSNLASFDYVAKDGIDFAAEATDINVVNLTLAAKFTSTVSVSATDGEFNLDAAAKGAGANINVGDEAVALGLGISKKSDTLSVSVDGSAAALDENDTLYLNDGGKLDDIEYTTDNDLKYGDASIVDAFVNGAEGSFNYNIGGETGVLRYGSNTGKKVVTYTEGVDYYLGAATDTTVNASDYEGDVVINLDGSGDAKYSEEITGIKGVGSGLVAGRSKVNNNIEIATEAGKKTEVYGGVGGTDTIDFASADEDSTNVIWYSNDDGKDTVKNFKNGNNSVYFHDATAAASVLNEVVAVKATGEMTVTLAKGKDILTLDNASGKTVEFNDAAGNAFKVAVGDGSNVTYDATANIYKNATTLKVDGSDDLIIYTGANNDQYGYFDGIMTIDASEATGTVALSGSDTNGLKIIGGTGVNNMWGGGSKVQVLEGNEDAVVNVFWFGTGDGKDIADNAQATDGVNLYNVEKIDDVAVKAGNTSFTVTIGNDVLKVNTAGDATEVLKDFTFADKSGVLYTYNTETSKFQKK